MPEFQKSPKELGYYFPAEWEEQESMWISYPQNLETWSQKQLQEIYPIYYEWIEVMSQGQKVNILCSDEVQKDSLQNALAKTKSQLSKVFFHLIPTNDAWIRDYGPSFLINPKAEEKKMIIDWQFNSWGEKYPPFELDNQVPQKIAQTLDIPYRRVSLMMEGGSIEVNGQGLLMTTESCLLNPNRNPTFTKKQIEWYLMDNYGQNQILWLKEGLVGDDTDGHIDDLARFVDRDTVLIAQESKVSEANHHILKENRKILENFRFSDGKALEIIDLPLPRPVIQSGEQMPASYLNFLIANEVVIMPIFKVKEDVQARDILEKCFPSRKVIGLDSRAIIWGLGSFHCLSQQEPKI